MSGFSKRLAATACCRSADRASVSVPGQGRTWCRGRQRWVLCMHRPHRGRHSPSNCRRSRNSRSWPKAMRFDVRNLWMVQTSSMLSLLAVSGMLSICQRRGVILMGAKQNCQSFFGKENFRRWFWLSPCCCPSSFSHQMIFVASREAR